MPDNIVPPEFREESKPDKNYNLDVIITTALFVALSIIVSTLVFKSYSITLFVATPLLSGFICSLLLAYNKNNTLGNCIRKGLWALFIATAIVLLFAIEGIICIIMASPILAVLNITGSVIGYYLADFIKLKRRIPVLFSVFILNPVFIAVESQQKPELKTISTETSLLVNATENVVWESLISKNNYNGFDNFFFRSGVAYPQSTSILNENNTNYFLCVYSQGQVKLPVLNFVENKRLEFGFEETPAPMKELSFYSDLHLPHLHGYFNISSGQIELKKINAKQTLLTARTTYTYNIKPLFYWKRWTNYLLNEVHQQVLTTIKTRSEENTLEQVAQLPPKK